MAKNSIQVLAAAIAKKHKITVAQAATFVEAVFDIVTEELKNNNQVKIKGLGTFKVLSVKPRESVNVNTGERVLIEGHDKISFTPDAAMKELVNKPFSQFETVVLRDDVHFKDEEDLEADDEENSEEVPVTEAKMSIGNIEIEKQEEVIAENASETASNMDKTTIQETIKEPLLQPEEPSKKEGAVSVSTLTMQPEKKETSSNIEDPTREILMPANTDGIDKISPLAKKAQDKVDRTEVEIDDEDEESSEDRTLWMMLKIVGIVISLIIIFFIGRTITRNMGVEKQVVKQNAERPAAKTVRKKKVGASLPTTSPQTPQASVADEPINNDANKYLSLSNDPRIRYGAYNIIGIEKVVVLKKGETMASYSKKTLGSGMVGYFQVLNSKDEMGPGDTLKVPKVEYRPQYQNR